MEKKLVLTGLSSEGLTPGLVILVYLGWRKQWCREAHRAQGNFPVISFPRAPMLPGFCGSAGARPLPDDQLFFTALL